MHPWQHLPQLLDLLLIICWCAPGIPRNASLQSESIVLCFLHFWRELMHSMLAQASFSCVARNYFVCMFPWQHLPHLFDLTLIICLCAFCIESAALSNLSIVLCFLGFFRESLHSLLAQASFSCVPKNYFVFMHPWQHLPQLFDLLLIICCCVSVSYTHLTLPTICSV